MALAVPFARPPTTTGLRIRTRVCFLDRYGNPIGSRGISTTNKFRSRNFPTISSSDARHRGSPLLRHFGIDVGDPSARGGQNAQAAACARALLVTQQLARNCSSQRAHIESKVRKTSSPSGWRRPHKNEILKLYLDRA